MTLRVTVLCVVLLALLYCTTAQVVTTNGLLFTATNTNKQIVTYTLIPGITNYTLTLIGGSGGNTETGGTSYSQGRPATVVGNLVVTDPTITSISIIAGARGATATTGPTGTTASMSGGGGGGSFVFANTSLIFAAAGGGGGQNYAVVSNWGNSYLGDATTTTAGGSGWVWSSGSWIGVADNGLNGNGDGGYNSTGKGWIETVRNPSARAPVQYSTYWDTQGGWGGGGNGYAHCSGGGGGYSGGTTPHTSNTYCYGGGGGSFAHPTFMKNPSITIKTAYEVMDGFVLISTNCPTGNGTMSMAQDLCICRSGYSGQICVTSPPGECGAGIIPNTTASEPHPAVSFQAFANSSLVMRISAPYTAGRRFNSLRFVGAVDNRCALHYGKGYLRQSFSNCSDVFTINLPWTQHVACGFNLTGQDDTQYIWKGTVIMEYEEFFANYAGFSRLERQTYNIFITFPRKLQVTTTNMTLFSVVPLEYSFVGEWYDAVNKELTLEIDTVLGYSAMIASDVPMTISTPAGISVSQQTQFNNTRCTEEVDSICLQRITFKIKTADDDTVCTYNGMYRLNSTIIACRNGTYCWPTKVSISFGVSSGSVCTKVSLTPPISGVLLAYPSDDFTGQSPSTFFSIGEIAYFRASIDAGLGNEVSITFIDIKYEDNRGRGVKSLLNNTALAAHGISTYLKINNTAKWFSLVFDRATFDIPINTGVLYTFTADIAVVFKGNQKRRVQAAWEMGETRKIAQTRVSIMSDGEGEDEFAEENENETPVHSVHQSNDLSVGAVAAIAVCAAVVALVAGFAGVALYFKRMGAQEYAAVDAKFEN